ncbi:hypothetical protein LT85_0473 [Collimonas arenae]|uniref:Uncharacterized protein n=1 Tax=Collimonas arenae TaxID=279058 RepID=A0A0A1F4I8_9BURK|nr:hypothetical protein LT85_0473 [Collimonas arenae]
MMQSQEVLWIACPQAISIDHLHKEVVESLTLDDLTNNSYRLAQRLLCKPKAHHVAD